jgi:thiosulfate/3-mercaptopyruvate sulfurtransferase
MIHDTLIDAATVLALQAARSPTVVFDCGFDLADPLAGERAWRASHLPGSRYLHLDRDLSGAKTGRNGRHPLPDRAAFARTLGRCDVTPTVQVVVLDRQGGPYAARAWWLMRWMGHRAVAVLDGGLDAWVAAGGELTADAAPADADAAPYPEGEPGMATVDADTLLRDLGRVKLIDARAAERFRGEVEPLDAAAGHIPGALNRFFKDNLGADGRFKPAALLRAEFDALLGRTGPASAVHQCGSGVTACHTLLAMEVAGLTGSRLYAGSWSEWSADPARPIARG